MDRAIVTLVMLVLGAVALARGFYFHAELTRQLETRPRSIFLRPHGVEIRTS
jgi:hypothetical protein